MLLTLVSKLMKKYHAQNHAHNYNAIELRYVLIKFKIHNTSFLSSLLFFTQKNLSLLRVLQTFTLFRKSSLYLPKTYVDPNFHASSE